jgi:AAA domain
LPTKYADYDSPSTDEPTSIVWASNGGDGSGKSYFALTAPKPLFVCAFDCYGLNRVNKDLIRGQDIKIARYPFNAQLLGDDKKKVGNAAMAVWGTFLEDYAMALKNCRTILWDREDIAWELLRYASFGGASNTPSAYGDLNAEYVSLIQDAYGAGVNLGLLRGIREKWVSKFDPSKAKMVAHNTGEMIPDGMKKIPDHVDVTLHHRWDGEQKAFMVKIDKFVNPDFKGEEFPNLTFPQMATCAYPNTEESAWSSI